MGDGYLGGGTAYGVAADGGDDGFADAGDVLPVREELLRVRLGNFPSLKRQRLKLSYYCSVYAQDLSFISLISAPAVSFVGVAGLTTPKAAPVRTCKGPFGTSEDYSTDLLVGINEAERLIEFGE